MKGLEISVLAYLVVFYTLFLMAAEIVKKVNWKKWKNAHFVKNCNFDKFFIFFQCTVHRKL